MKSGHTAAGARAASSHTAALAGSGGRGRRALPPDRRPPRRHAGRAPRPGGAAFAPAAAARTAGGGADQRRRPRHPLRRRVRGGRPDPADALRPHRDGAARHSCPRRRATRIPSTSLGLGDGGRLRARGAASARRSARRRADRPVRPARQRGSRRGRRCHRARCARRREARAGVAARRRGGRAAVGVRRLSVPGIRGSRARSRRRAGRLAEPAGRDRSRARRHRPGGGRGDRRRRLEDARTAAGSTPSETKQLLEAYGIPLVPQRDADSPQEAADAARELGFPVVVKSAAAGSHKTETGGVALDLATRPPSSRPRRASAAR